MINIPLYDYICRICGTTVEEYAPMSRYQSEIPCPKCNNGTMMKREFMNQAPNTFGKAFSTPIEMYSVAPGNPTELAAFRKRNPDVQLNNQLVPIARNRAEKLRILKNENFEERS